MSYLHEDPHACAKRMGLTVIVADDTMLQLDIDTVEQRRIFTARLPELRAAHDKMGASSVNQFIGDMLTTSSKSGHTHIYLCLNDRYSAESRIAWQMYLGSDPQREMLSLMRIKFFPNMDPVVLFETDEDAAQYAAWAHLGWKMLGKGAHR